MFFSLLFFKYVQELLLSFIVEFRKQSCRFFYYLIKSRNLWTNPNRTQFYLVLSPKFFAKWHLAQKLARESWSPIRPPNKGNRTSSINIPRPHRFFGLKFCSDRNLFILFAVRKGTTPAAGQWSGKYAGTAVEWKMDYCVPIFIFNFFCSMGRLHNIIFNF